jgi:hypothetical protein
MIRRAFTAGDRKAGGLALWLLLASLVAQAFVPGVGAHARTPASASSLAGSDAALLPPGGQKAGKVLKARGQDDDPSAGPDTPDSAAHSPLQKAHAQRFAPASPHARAYTASLPHPGIAPFAPRAPPAV